MKKSLFLALATILVALPLSATQLSAAQVSVESTGAALIFSPQGSHGGMVVTVATPDGTVHELRGNGPVSYSLFSADGSARVDGSYNWEVLLLPKLSDADRDALAAARESGDNSVFDALRLAGSLDSSRTSGAFAVAGGAFVIDDGTVVESIAPGKEASVDAAIEKANDLEGLFKAQVFATDVIVQGSECVGFDCVNGESFGFDTLRLKENNLRIHFQDTSNTASFPSVDWRIVANDTGNGGANYLAFEDSNTGRQPFRVEANAPANALYVEDDGDVGIKTSTPVVDLHIVEGNTPTLRLEQDGSDGFQAQTFDVAANEANFFIRDVTNGSKLSFRIRPGAPESSIDIAGDGDIGMGTTSPDSALHVRRTGGNPSVVHVESGDLAQVLVESTSTTSATRELFLGQNFGPPRFSIENTSNGSKWFVGQNGSGSLTLSKAGTVSNEMRLNGLDEANAGRATFPGDINALAFNPTSDRNMKTAFDAVDVTSILAKVVELPLSSWQFISDKQGYRHLGPMAQDFYAAFGLGIDERHISTVDADGVALASIQALHQQLQAKDAQIETLEQRLSALEAALEALAAER